MSFDVDQYLDHIRCEIDRHGWVVQCVVGKPASFAYTVGLTPKGRPELFVPGLPAVLAQPMLNSLATQILNGPVKLGTQYEVPFGTLSGPVVLQDHPAGFKAVIVAHALYGRAQVLTVFPEIPGISRETITKSLDVVS